MIFGVYIHARPTGEAFYVGKGKRSRAYSLKPRNRYHANIVAKYGEENIIVDFVPCESEEAAFAKEIEWIATLRLFGAKLTNQTDGGEGMSNPAPDVRVKLSTARKAMWSDNERRASMSAKMKGRIYSEESIAKMREAAKGNTKGSFVRTAEHCAKLSAALKGNQNTKGYVHSAEACAKMGASKLGNQYSKGRILSKESRAKISAALKEKPKSDETRAKMRTAHIGKQLSDETRAKMRASQKAAWARRKEQMK